MSQHRLLSEQKPKFQMPRPLVLVVDDSSFQRRIVSVSLKKWNYEVVEAASGDEALAQCEERFPDIVLSDWMMPGMTGLEFCRLFRAISGERYGYFILLTSKSEKNDIALGLDSGADDFLTKPVNTSELRARITAGERILTMQRELTEKNRMITLAHTELRRVYDSLDSDLLEAKKLQQSLLPVRHKKMPQADLSLMLRSSGHVGGDLVGFFPAGKDKIGLFAIDVSGHGISSALMTARLAGYLSANAPDQNIALSRQKDGSYAPLPPKDVIEDLNEMVLTEMETEHYFTLLLAIADINTGLLEVAQAGHPHPAIQRADGRIEQEGTGGFPVGLLSGVTFEQFTIQLAPGERVLFLSDGVIECPNPGGDMLGEEGLAQMLHKLEGVAGENFLEALTWRLTDFFGGADFPDDVSGILFEYHGAPA